MSKKIVDCVMYLDGLHLNEGESMDDVAEHIKSRYELSYDIIWSVNYEETVAD